jgi:hypothetical protein
LLLHQFVVGWVLLAGSAVCAVMLYRGVVRNFAVEPEDSAVGNSFEAAPSS